LKEPKVSLGGVPKVLLKKKDGPGRSPVRRGGGHPTRQKTKGIFKKNHFGARFLNKKVGKLFGGRRIKRVFGGSHCSGSHTPTGEANSFGGRKRVYWETFLEKGLKNRQNKPGPCILGKMETVGKMGRVPGMRGVKIPPLAKEGKVGVVEKKKGRCEDMWGNGLAPPQNKGSSEEKPVPRSTAWDVR